MKRFIIALSVMIGIMFVTMISFSNIESKYDHKPAKPLIYVIDEDMNVIRFANSNDDIPTYMKHRMDFVCEIDSIKYYLIN